MKKVLRVAFYMAGCSLILMGGAFAYLDPSVMTYSVQVIAGIIIAVGAVIGVVWRRAKKKVQDKLGIDENANKEVEEEVVMNKNKDQ